MKSYPRRRHCTRNIFPHPHTHTHHPLAHGNVIAHLLFYRGFNLPVKPDSRSREEESKTWTFNIVDNLPKHTQAHSSGELLRRLLVIITLKLSAMVWQVSAQRTLESCESCELQNNRQRGWRGQTESIFKNILIFHLMCMHIRLYIKTNYKLPR